MLFDVDVCVCPARVTDHVVPDGRPVSENVAAFGEGGGIGTGPGYGLLMIMDGMMIGSMLYVSLVFRVKGPKGSAMLPEPGVSVSIPA